MIPDDVLLAIGRSPPPLLNEDRPFLASIASDSSIAPAFGAAVAAALRDGSARTTVDPTPDACDPSSEGRAFTDVRARSRTGGPVLRVHEILVDWRAEEHLIRMAGMVRRDVDLGALSEQDGTPVEDRRAITRIACLSAEIAARTLVAPPMDDATFVAVHDLMAAFAAACCTTLPGESVVVTAPSPWGPAEIRLYSEDDDRMGDVVDVDAGIEAMLPVAMEIQVVEDDVRDLDRIRIDALAIMIGHADMPTPMEAARTLAAGWPA